MWPAYSHFEEDVNYYTRTGEGTTEDPYVYTLATVVPGTDAPTDNEVIEEGATAYYVNLQEVWEQEIVDRPYDVNRFRLYSEDSEYVLVREKDQLRNTGHTGNDGIFFIKDEDSDEYTPYYFNSREDVPLNQYYVYFWPVYARPTLTTDTTFQEGTNYYIPKGYNYGLMLADVTVGDPIPPNTYYIVSLSPQDPFYVAPDNNSGEGDSGNTGNEGNDSASYVVTSHSTFQQGTTYYTRTGSGTTADPYVYTPATVTVGDTVPANTYYVAVNVFPGFTSGRD